MRSDGKQTRRKIAARLLLLCLWVCCAGILLIQGADAVRSLAPASVSVRHQDQPIVRALPDTAGKTDINRATAEDLQQASGIGPALAQRILEMRDARGGFHFLEELLDVSGIGQKRFEALRALFYCPAFDP